MHNSDVYKWVTQDQKRRKILLSMKQPLTAKQVARKTRIDVDTCSYIIMKFHRKGLVICMNPKARCCRLYGLTDIGREYQERFQTKYDLPNKSWGAFAVPRVNWELYGWVCFKHRSAVIRALNAPMQPSEIKHMLRIHNPSVKISANNIRDIIRLFLGKDVVRKVFCAKKAHPQYELTPLGMKMQKLLFQAEMPL